MGLSEDDQKILQEQRLNVYGAKNIIRNVNDPSDVNNRSGSICSSQVDSLQCCQVNGGSFSCCQNSSSEEKGGDGIPPVVVPNVAPERKKRSKLVSRNNSGKDMGPRKVCSMPTWYENWEHEDTYAGLAVIGAAISVTFSYSCYKNLG